MNIKAELEKYMTLLDQIAEEFFASTKSYRKHTFRLEIGKKYAKIVCETTSSVHSFIDMTNGDILKAATYKAPAKHPRGNIINISTKEELLNCVDVYGAKYLRG